MTTRRRATPRRCSPDGSLRSRRRGLLKSAGLGGLSLAAMMRAPLEEQIAYASQNVNRNSKPSDLRITDLRIAQIRGAPMRVPIIRIDTNQGLTGYGEVRDGGSPRYALMLKSRLLGENPCNVERLFRQTQAVWFPRPAGRRRQRRGDGPLGSCRQGLRGPRVPDARRSLPRPGPPLCRYHHLARPCRVRAAD